MINYIEMVIIIKKFPEIVNNFQKNLKIYKKDLKYLKSYKFFKKYDQQFEQHITNYTQLHYTKIYKIYDYIEKYYKSEKSKNFIFLKLNWDYLMLNMQFVGILRMITVDNFNLFKTGEYEEFRTKFISPKIEHYEKMNKNLLQFIRSIISNNPTKTIVTISSIMDPLSTLCYTNKVLWKQITKNLIIFSSSTTFQNKYRINILPYFLNMDNFGKHTKKVRDFYFKGRYNLVYGLLNDRIRMYNEVKNYKNSKIILMNVNEVNKNFRSDYIKMMNTSKYILCPSGYEDSSFRLYEAIKAKSIPIYIYRDSPSLPFTDVIDWKRLCILVEINNIKNILEIVNKIDEKSYKTMINYGQQIFNKYLTISGTSKKMIEILDKGKYKKSNNFRRIHHDALLLKSNHNILTNIKIVPTAFFNSGNYFSNKENFTFYKNYKKGVKIICVMLVIGHEYEKMVKPCIERKILYCKKNGYDLLICRKNLLDFVHDDTDIKFKDMYYLIWSKIIISYFVMNGYNWVWVTDADTYINNLSKKIETYLDSQYNLIINREHHNDSDKNFWKSIFKKKKFLSYNRVSTSDFILQNNNWSIRLLIELFNSKMYLEKAVKDGKIQIRSQINYKYFKDLQEQGYLNYIINTSKYFKNGTKILSKHDRISQWLEEYRDNKSKHGYNLRNSFSVDFQGIRGDLLKYMINLFANTNNRELTMKKIIKFVKKSNYCINRKQWNKTKTWKGKNPDGWTFDNNKIYDQRVLFPGWCLTQSEIEFDGDVLKYFYSNKKRTDKNI